VVCIRVTHISVVTTVTVNISIVAVDDNEPNTYYQQMVPTVAVAVVYMLCVAGASVPNSFIVLSFLFIVTDPISRALSSFCID
jgi:hypothetical protein